MAKKTTEQLQKEYDEIIITLDRLNNAVKQSQQTFNWFNNRANKATQREKNEALSNQHKAEAELYVYEQLIKDRKEALENSKRVNQRTAQDIEAEKYKDNFSSANF